MTFNLWTFLFEIVNFVVLAYVLYRLLYHPLRQAVEERRAATDKTQADAEAARQGAVALEEKLKIQMAGMDRERQDAMRLTREQADAERLKVLAETEQTAQRRQEEARKALEQERTEALASLQDEVIRQAANLTERFLSEAVDGNVTRQLALKLIDRLNQMPANERNDLQREWKPADGATLETAQNLDEATQRRITEALAAVLDQQVNVSVRTDVNLIGGVRLRLGGRVWDASWAGNLQQLHRADGEAGHA